MSLSDLVTPQVLQTPLTQQFISMASRSRLAAQLLRELRWKSTQYSLPSLSENTIELRTTILGSIRKQMETDQVIPEPQRRQTQSGLLISQFYRSNEMISCRPRSNFLCNEPNPSLSRTLSTQISGKSLPPWLRQNSEEPRSLFTPDRRLGLKMHASWCFHFRPHRVRTRKTCVTFLESLWTVAGRSTEVEAQISVRWSQWNDLTHCQRKLLPFSLSRLQKPVSPPSPGARPGSKVCPGFREHTEQLCVENRLRRDHQTCPPTQVLSWPATDSIFTQIPATSDPPPKLYQTKGPWSHTSIRHLFTRVRTPKNVTEIFLLWISAHNV